MRRISYTYDSLGRRDEVTQYDNATVGSGTIVNEVKHTYDDWGRLTNFEQDHDSAVGAGTPDDYEAKYTYAKSAPSAGWQTLRLASRELVYASTSKDTVNYDYLSTGGLVDDSISRVTRVKDGTTILASYDYLGRGFVVGVDVEPLNVMWHKYNETTTSTMDDLDRFNRVTTCKWTKDLSTDVDFYHCDMTLGKVGQIYTIDDTVYPGWDWHLTNDTRNRLLTGDRGTLSGGSITNRTFRERWTLDQLGNWSTYKLDLNGDGDELDTDEINETRTHNTVNEVTSGSITYDALGEFTDDGTDNKYVYDAFGRLVEIKNRAGQPKSYGIFEYNGLGHRITAVYDSDGNGKAEPGTDDTLHYAYDAQWRMIGLFKNSSSSPSEQMIHHVGGAFGRDGILTRLKSFITHYPLQNWRGDVVVSFRSSDLLPDHSRFTPYGIPYVIRAVDFDNDGDYDDDDDTFYTDTRDLGPYDVRCDFDLNGRVDSSDDTLYLEAVGINLFGRGELSNEGNVFGYAGYVHDGVFFEKQHVRARVLDGELGRWGRRDPAGYVDGMSLYEYVRSAPLASSSSSGSSGDDLIDGTFLAKPAEEVKDPFRFRTDDIFDTGDSGGGPDPCAGPAPCLSPQCAGGTDKINRPAGSCPAGYEPRSDTFCNDDGSLSINEICIRCPTKCSDGALRLDCEIAASEQNFPGPCTQKIWSCFCPTELL